MTAAEVIISPIVSSPTSAHLARKRRREKMREAAAANAPNDTSQTIFKELQTKGILPPKKRKISTDQSDPSSTSLTKSCAKKQVAKTKVKRKGKTNGRKQMRYDPDVPMTKEEASAWRREARRVRNRESAAASRRKIRDRIEVLEEEVEQWKAKYEAVLLKLQEVSKHGDEFVLSGPCVSPLHGSEESPVPVTSISADQSSFSCGSDGNSKRHLIETILRPAVKIAGDALFPDPTPDTCLSQPMIDVMPNSIGFVSSSDDSSKECPSTHEDDELEDFVYDTFLTGIEPDFLISL